MKKTLLSCKWLLLLSGTMLFWTSCQKEIKPEFKNDTPTQISNQIVSGVIPDDPIAVGKVPLLVSAEFLAKGFAPDGTASGLLRGKPIKVTGDVAAPTVTITSPGSGATVSSAINVAVSTSDNVGVTSVSLSIDAGSAVSTSTASPFTNTWNSASVANGTHTLKVTATDAAGNKATNSIQVNVNNVAPGDITSPVVSIINPTDQSSVTGTVAVSMSASDNVGVSSVSISIDNTVVSTSTSYSWNTSNFSAGLHTVTATAKDAAGNQNNKSVTVTVNTTTVPPPPSTSGVSLAMPAVGNQGGEGSCVAFAVGYAARSAEQYYGTNASSYNNSTNVFSPEFLYNQIKFSSDCGSGTSMQTALDFIKLNGVSTFQTMPYSGTNGCSLLPTTAQITEALNYKIGGYSKIIYTDRTAIKSMVSQKHPVIITILADNSFVNAKTGFIWKTFSGSGMLAHCIAICGYDDAKVNGDGTTGAYKVMNSWGTGWGDAGYSWITYNFFETGGRIAGGGYVYVIN
jgi:hypothetical protein